MQNKTGRRSMERKKKRRRKRMMDAVLKFSIKCGPSYLVKTKTKKRKFLNQNKCGRTFLAASSFSSFAKRPSHSW